MPERLLIRDMKYRHVSVPRTAGELAYTAVSVALAASGWGGFAIVLGNVARSLVRTGMMTYSAGWREWFTPMPAELEAAA